MTPYVLLEFILEIEISSKNIWLRRFCGKKILERILMEHLKTKSSLTYKPPNDFIFLIRIHSKKSKYFKNKNFQHKFGSFFAESFTNVDLLRFEYDQDSVVVIPPGAPFSLNKKKTRKDDQKDGSSLLSDMANFEQRKVRTRSGRHNSESIRVSSDDEAPTKRIRLVFES